MTYEFTTKAEYLSATTMWKADFKAHIQMIRTLKCDFKNAQRAFAKDSAYYGLSYREQERIREAIVEAGVHTSELLSQRSSMKIEAQRQYLSQQTV